MSEPFIHQMEPHIDACEADHMNEYLRSGAWLTEFKKTQELEGMLCEYTGSKHCTIVANGTVSLAIALWVAGIGPGDEVLVPNFTMIATANSVKLVGATPVFVDIEASTLCMDLDKARAALTERTKAISLVTLNGRAPDMAAYRAFCDEHKLFFLEDAAQSLGSFQNGKHLGCYGDVGSFSFSSQKIVTMGQGGALITDDEALHARIRKCKDFGRQRGGTDWHDELGYNFKVTDMQSVIGIEQMKKLPARVERKKEIWKQYEQTLGAVDGLELVPVTDECAPWFIDLYVEEREGLIAHLKEQGIGARMVYPPITHQEIYERKEGMEVSERYCARGVWLPSSITLTDEQIARVCREVIAWKNS